MKKTFLFVMVFSLLLGLSAREALAQQLQCPPGSGCACDVWQMTQNHANAVRALDNAYAAQVIKKNEPVAALTCLDQQLKLTAHLGSFFADKKISGTFSTKSFCGFVVSISGSASATLAAHLNDIVLPSLGDLLGLLNLSIPDLGFSICAPTFTVPTISLPTLSLSLPGLLGACLPSTSIGGGSVGGQSFGGQCVGFALPSIDCKNIAKFWEGIEGSGQQSGTPYTSFRDLVSGTVTGAGPEFQAQLGNDSAILSKALDDLNKLSGPGSIPSWPVTPVLSPNASTSDIISAM